MLNDECGTMNMKQRSANKKSAAWLREKRFKRWIDLPSLFIACCWVGMLLLWPETKLHQEERIPQYKSMVVAHDINYSDENMYHRPDLIALPSNVSFAPDGDDKNDVMPLKKKKLQTSMLYKRQVNEVAVDDKPEDVAMAAEAIRDVGRSLRFGMGRREMAAGGAGANNGKGVLVCVSGNIGDDAVLAWTESDYLALFGGDRAWDIELSLRIEKNGLPSAIFLEKPSGDSSVDSGVVHALSRADLWQNVMPGYGAVLISYSP